MLLTCGVGEDSWESLGLQGDPTSPSYGRSVLGVHWKDWCWSWNFNTLATSCEELTHLKRPWCWEGLRAGGEGDDRGWDGWMASPTQWAWVWVNSGSWWWTGRPGVLWFTGSQRVRHDWATELNWTEEKHHVGWKCTAPLVSIQFLGSTKSISWPDLKRPDFLPPRLKLNSWVLHATVPLSRTHKSKRKEILSQGSRNPDCIGDLSSVQFLPFSEIEQIFHFSYLKPRLCM